MRRLHDFSKWFLIAMVLMFAACAQLGVAPADTFNKKLAAAYGAVDAVAVSVAQSRDTGTISPDTAKAIGLKLSEVVAALDAAASMSKTNLSAADTRLTLVIATLTSVQAELQRRSAPPARSHP